MPVLVYLSRATIAFFVCIIARTLGSLRQVLVEMLSEVKLAGVSAINALEPICVVREQDD